MRSEKRKFEITRLENRIVPSALSCSLDCGSTKSDKSCKSAKSDKSCKSDKSEKCGSSKKGNNGYGNGGRDGSPNGKQDRTR
jgi:hypothetical protein